MNKIFLTVDTECHDLNRENQYIWGKCKKGEFGVKRILEYGKKYSIPINFFVDFAEIDIYGIDYIKNIVEVISSYGQPIFLHLHPEYISKDRKRTFFWEYSANEQQKIINRGIGLYKKIMGKKPVAFRAGRYGINQDTLDILSEKLPGIIDFSYLGESGQMCHVSEDLVHTRTHFVNYKKIGIFPTTQFIGLDLAGIQKRIGVDASEMSLVEFEEFIKKAEGKDFVLTMHSWNFINKFFWNHQFVGMNRTAVRRFEGMIEIARRYGYEFISIEGYNFQKNGDIKDIDYNACEGNYCKIRSIWINFLRFQNIAKISKKYFYFYSIFYLTVLGVAGTIIFTFLKGRL